MSSSFGNTFSLAELMSTDFSAFLDPPSLVIIKYNEDDDMETLASRPGLLLPLSTAFDADEEVADQEGKDENESVAGHLSKWWKRRRDDRSSKKCRESIMLMRPDLKLSAKNNTGSQQIHMYPYICQRMSESRGKWQHGHLQRICHKPDLEGEEEELNEPMPHHLGDPDSTVVTLRPQWFGKHEHLAQELYRLLGENANEYYDDS